MRLYTYFLSLSFLHSLHFHNQLLAFKTYHYIFYILCGFRFSVSAESYIAFSSSSFFFFFAFTRLRGRQNLLFMRQMSLFTHYSDTVHALFTGPTTLLTHLKIILLQCFQFSVFSFSKNKFNPNTPTISLGKRKYYWESSWYYKLCRLIRIITKVDVLLYPRGSTHNILVYYTRNHVDGMYHLKIVT